MDKNSTLETEAEVKNGIKRLVFAGVAIILQVTAILLVYFRFAEQAEWFAIGTRVLGALLVLFIYNDERPSASKMTWIILIMALPIMGVVLYLLIGLNSHTFKMRKRYEQVDERLMPLLPDDAAAQARLALVDGRAANIARYLNDMSLYPLYDDTAITYYDDAAKGIEAQKEELRRAERFIFMEYHAIEDAESWHAIQSILEERVRAGVEVRVFYDDMGSIGFVNTDFVKRLEAVGIKAKVFNPFAPGLNLFLNNRDHRKVTVVDGRVGFTGGYNIANEYFNITHPFGHWKDTGVRLEGPAVQSLTATFLEMWNASVEGDVDDAAAAYKRYLPAVPANELAQGFVQPYADSPMDGRGRVHLGGGVCAGLRLVRDPVPHHHRRDDPRAGSGRPQGRRRARHHAGHPRQEDGLRSHAVVLLRPRALRCAHLRVHARLLPLQDERGGRQACHLWHHQPGLSQPLPPLRERLPVLWLRCGG